MSRRHRKIYKQGKAEGYALGYAQGLHDGNPFIRIVETAARAIEDITKGLSDPEVVKALIEAEQLEQEQDEEGNNEDT